METSFSNSRRCYCTPFVPLICLSNISENSLLLLIGPECFHWMENPYMYDVTKDLVNLVRKNVLLSRFSLKTIKVIIQKWYYVEKITYFFWSITPLWSLTCVYICRYVSSTLHLLTWSYGITFDWRNSEFYLLKQALSIFWGYMFGDVWLCSDILIMFEHILLCTTKVIRTIFACTRARPWQLRSQVGDQRSITFLNANQPVADTKGWLVRLLSTDLYKKNMGPDTCMHIHRHRCNQGKSAWTLYILCRM
jgi:hypothetical protein